MSNLINDLQKQRAALEEELWKVQLEVYPDSRRLSLKDVYGGWLGEAHPGLNAAMDAWDERHKDLFWAGSERLIARVSYAEKLMQDYRLQITTGLCMILQYPAFVFYECGKRDDGSYRYRGCRVGLEAHQYLGGFGRF